MADLKDIVNKVVLPLQLSLGLFQIIRSTPLWAVIHCALASFLNFFHFPYTDYKHLERFKGRVFKKVTSHTTTAGTKWKDPKKEGKSVGEQKDPQKEGKSVEEQKDPQKEWKSVGEQKDPQKPTTEGTRIEYLGKSFELKVERSEDKNIMVLMNGGPVYYITDKMWETVKNIGKVAKKTVFLKDHKEIWEEVVTGDIMEFEEVLDSVILDNRTIIRLDNDYFLPVNLVKSEMRLTTTLNFVGLFLKTQKDVNWFIPALLFLVAALMGFSTALRFHISRLINTILCRSLRLLFDLLPFQKRRLAYSMVNWVENLKASNDLKSKTVSGSTVALVGGGAKLIHSYQSPDGNNGMHVILDVIHFSVDVITFSQQHKIRVFVDRGCVRGNAREDSSASEPWDIHPLKMAHEDKTTRILLTGGTKAQHWVEPDVVGPLLFPCDTVYIEWIYNNITNECSLKAGRTVPLDEPLIHQDVFICDAVVTEAKSYPFCCGKERNVSLIVDDFDTTSIEVECESEEAIKLLIFAFYMAKYKTTSLKSYDRKTRKATFRRFVESVHAYASSRFPEHLYTFIMEEDVVAF